MPESPARSGSRRRATPVLTVLAVLLALVATTLSTAAPASAARLQTARPSYAAAIEPLAGYQAQTTCSPRAKPGVVDFSQRLLRAFPTTRSLGIVRSCAAGGRSEHKEGRAFDWAVDARSADDRARVERVMTWLMRTDRYGNRFARARRLGLQYVIWNKRIWGSYAAESGWRRYRGASPHTDHVHFSFTWSGARQRTSFWTGKVGNVWAAPTPTLPRTPPVPPAPAPPPVTTPLPPVSTPPLPRPTTPRPTVPTPTVPPAPPEPRRPPELLAGPALEDETLTVPAGGRAVLTTGALQAGQAYALEVTGTVRWGPHPDDLADGECSRTAADPTWRRDRSVHPAAGSADHLDLYLDGADLAGNPDVTTGDGCDTRSHTYRSTVTATRTGRAPLQLWDPTTTGDEVGAVSVRLVALTARSDMTWRLPANAPAGVMSPGAVEAGATYLLTVTGTVDAGGRVTSDAECSTTTADLTWLQSRSLDPTAAPTADHLDVLVDRRGTTFTPVHDPDGDGCDTATHAYRSVLTPRSTSVVELRVDDPAWSDNSGELVVRVQRVDPPVGTETVVVDAAGPDVETARNYLAGQPLLVRATGRYTYAAGTEADAECSATTEDPVWRSSRSALVVERVAMGDVTIGGRLPDWLTASGARCDPVTHAYSLTHTPSHTGPLRLGVADLDRSDNVGTLTVTITPVGG